MKYEYTLKKKENSFYSMKKILNINHFEIHITLTRAIVPLVIRCVYICIRMGAFHNLGEIKKRKGSWWSFHQIK